MKMALTSKSTLKKPEKHYRYIYNSINVMYLHIFMEDMTYLFPKLGFSLCSMHMCPPRILDNAYIFRQCAKTATTSGKCLLSWLKMVCVVLLLFQRLEVAYISEYFVQNSPTCPNDVHNYENVLYVVILPTKVQQNIEIYVIECFHSLTYWLTLLIKLRCCFRSLRHSGWSVQA